MKLSLMFRQKWVLWRGPDPQWLPHNNQLDSAPSRRRERQKHGREPGQVGERRKCLPWMAAFICVPSTFFTKIGWPCPRAVERDGVGRL